MCGTFVFMNPNRTVNIKSFMQCMLTSVLDGSLDTCQHYTALHVYYRVHFVKEKKKCQQVSDWKLCKFCMGS